MTATYVVCLRSVHQQVEHEVWVVFQDQTTDDVFVTLTNDAITCKSRHVVVANLDQGVFQSAIVFGDQVVFIDQRCCEQPFSGAESNARFELPACHLLKAWELYVCAESVDAGMGGAMMLARWKVWLIKCCITGQHVKASVRVLNHSLNNWSFRVSKLRAGMISVEPISNTIASTSQCAAKTGVK